MYPRITHSSRWRSCWSWSSTDSGRRWAPAIPHSSSTSSSKSLQSHWDDLTAVTNLLSIFFKSILSNPVHGIHPPIQETANSSPNHQIRVYAKVIQSIFIFKICKRESDAVRTYSDTYLIKAKTLSMKFIRFIGVAAMSKYFLDSSLGPPMAIETLRFGFFSFKLTTSLYWPARWQNKQNI